MPPTPESVDTSANGPMVVEDCSPALSSQPQQPPLIPPTETLPHLTRKKKLANGGNRESRRRKYLSQRDTGYAWVVCCASFVAQLLQGGLMYSMGMFYIILKKNLKGDATSISLISSINAAIAFGAAPLAGKLFAKFGGRTVGIAGSLCMFVGLVLTAFATDINQLYLTYGILTGLGMALQYNPCLSMLTIYFNKRLGLATGIASSGCGLGSIVYPYFVKYLDEQYGWRGALFLCGATQLQSLVCCALFRPLRVTDTPDSSDQEVNSRNCDMPKCAMSEDPTMVTLLKNGPELNGDCEKVARSENELTTAKNLRSGPCLSVFQFPQYLLFCTSQFFMNFSLSIIYTYAGAYAKSLDSQEDDAATVYFALGVSTTIMRFCAGLVLQIPGCRPLVVYTVSQITLGIVTLLSPLGTTMPLFLLYCGIYGVLSAPFITFNLNITTQIIPPDVVSSALGILLMFLAPGSLFGAPLAGFLYDKTGLFSSLFYLAGATIIISGLVTLPLCLDRWHWCEKTATAQEKSMELII